MADKSDSKILKQSKTRLEDCIDRESEERLKKKEDLKFVVLDQWPSDIRNERQNDPTGARPCLTIDKIGQYRMQIINEIRKNRPAVKVRPIDDGADVETAQVFQGLIRHIEDSSNADIAYETAAEWAIDTGEGYFRIVTDYIDPSKSSQQEIFIKPIIDGFSVYLGPHLLPDGSDAEYGFILEDITEAEFKRRFKGKKVPVPDKDSPFWVGKDHVRIAEYFYKVYETVTVLDLQDGTTVKADEYDGPDPGEEAPREVSIASVEWCKHTEEEILEETDWAGKYIPIVKVIGHQKLVDGKKRTWGIIRPAIDSARMYNYWASTITEKIGLAPKAPFIGFKGQFEDPKWKDANRKNYPYLEAELLEAGGQAVPLPRRQEPAPVEAAMIQQLSMIEHDIQTSLGMFKASVGQGERDQSGRAIRALQGQSDTATFHFPDNLATSIRFCGRQLIDLIPKVYDTQRVVRIIGSDDKPQVAQLNPDQQTALQKVRTQQGVQSIYNLGVGNYDVTVTVGPSYATKRMEAVDIMQETIKSAPQLIPVIGDLMFKVMDTPYADQIAERLKPGGDNPVAKIQQLTQQINNMGQGMQKLQQENTQLKAGAGVDMAKIQANHQAKMNDLGLTKMVEEEKARLARWVAEQEAALKAYIASEEKKLADAKTAMEMARKEQESHHSMMMDQKMQSESVMPQFMTTLETALKTFAESLKTIETTQADMNQKIATAITADRVAEVKMPDGKIIRAVSKVH